MELAQIRMFKTVAEVGSIARAAEVLHCVPSNITARIKSLEAELGVALFLREGAGCASVRRVRPFWPTPRKSWR
jgi:DNA-binding transcriptional LysR family regulator